MKGKMIIGLVGVVAIALCAGLVGCVPPPDKVTGGGWLYTDRYEESKVNFGFNVKSDDGFLTATGQFNLVDHSTKPPTRVHGTFEGKLGQTAAGTCTINGEGPYVFTLVVGDEGEPGTDDWVRVRVYIPGPVQDLRYEGYLQGGNIQFH
jgi:hypothetical protein